MGNATVETVTVTIRADETTLTEQKLCRIWLGATCGGEWWDMYQQMRAIADVLKTVGKHAAAEMFHDAGQLALARCVYDIQKQVAA